MRTLSQSAAFFSPGGKGFILIPVMVGLVISMAPAGAQPVLEIIDPISLNGTTGLATTPIASVIPHGTVAFGVSILDRKWAYHARGKSDNHHYFLTVGFFPRVEVSIRASYFPDGTLFFGAEEKGTVDRGGSGRILLLKEGLRTPAVALGAEDLRGTRRFHSLYAVASKTIDLPPSWLQTRVTAGFGSTALDAKVHVLDGVFGGGEVVISDFLSLTLDYDTEKWNTLIRLVAFKHLAARYALLNFEAPAGGLTWTHSF